MMGSLPPPSPPASRKRSYDGEMIISTPPRPTATGGQNHSATTGSARQSSPAPSVSSSTSSLTQLTPSIGQGAASSVGADGAKKRKLTFAEKEVERAVRKQEKEDRARRKAEEKAQKDDEKRQKAEEKEKASRQKEIEKAEKQKLKDAEKQAKDALKAQKDAEKAQKEAEKAYQEAEKLKKERSQMRLGAFFQKPLSASTPPSIPDDVSSGPSSRRSSFTSVDAELPNANFKLTRTIDPEFRKLFPPFFVHDNTEIAPINRYLNDQHILSISDVDLLLKGHKQVDDEEISHNLKVNLRARNSKSRRPRRVVPVKKLMAQIDDTSSAAIDLTDNTSTGQPRDFLATIPMKVICFSVDVRPPWQGTYTQVVSPRSMRKVSRRPALRVRPDTNYDYDSEVEWQEPEEGDEELLSDEDEIDGEDDEENMDDFLDDEDDMTKRRMIVGDVEPVNSGLCWQGNAASMDVEAGLKQYRMDTLDDAHGFPIDPFSTSYWAKLVKPSAPQLESKPSISTAVLMQPPRLPLSTVTSTNTLLNQGFLQPCSTPKLTRNTENMLPAKQRGRPADPNKSMKMISADLLPAFKHAIEGSDLTKAGLVEMLKKQFPKVSKDIIKDTLTVIAVRQGVKEVDKRWVVVV